MKKLFESPFLTVRYDEEQKVLWVARTSEPMPDVASGLSETERLRTTVSDIAPAETIFVFDSRAVVGRNDEVFEREVLPKWMALLSHYRRAAVLHRTMVGVLQTQRVSRAAHVDVRAFDDEVALRRWLLEQR